jgi:uncharacterized membrane protein YfcA
LAVNKFVNQFFLAVRWHVLRRLSWPGSFRLCAGTFCVGSLGLALSGGALARLASSLPAWLLQAVRWHVLRRLSWPGSFRLCAGTFCVGSFDLAFNSFSWCSHVQTSVWSFRWAGRNSLPSPL